MRRVTVSMALMVVLAQAVFAAVGQSQAAAQGAAGGEQEKVRKLIAKLSDPSAEVRYKTAEKIGNFGPAARAAVPHLVRLLGDEGKYYHIKTAEHTRDGRVMMPSGSGVYWPAIEALAKIGGSAVEPLLAACGRMPAKARWRPWRALANMTDARKAGPLLKRLADKDPTVRCYAAEVLYNMPCRRVIRALVASLKDPDPSVRATAACSLQVMVCVATTGELDQSPRAMNRWYRRLRWEAGEPIRPFEASPVLPRPEPPPVRELFDDIKVNDALLALLKDPEGNVRMAAFFALAETGDSRAVQPLTNMVKHVGELGKGNFAPYKYPADALTRMKDRIKHARGEERGPAPIRIWYRTQDTAVTVYNNGFLTYVWHSDKRNKWVSDHRRRPLRHWLVEQQDKATLARFVRWAETHRIFEQPSTFAERRGGGAAAVTPVLLVVRKGDKRYVAEPDTASYKVPPALVSAIKALLKLCEDIRTQSEEQDNRRRNMRDRP